MSPNPDFGFEQAASELIRGVVDAVTDLPGLTPERRFMKQKTAAFSVIGFQPTDPLQIMLAGHCVIYDALVRDGVQDLLRGQPEEIKLRSRPGNLASGRMFLSSLHTLRRIQSQGTASTSRPVTEPVIEVMPPAVAPAAQPIARSVDEPLKEAIAPRPDAAILLGEDSSAVEVEPATFRSRMRGTASNIAMAISSPDALALEAFANRNGRLGDVQAGTVSTARTQRAMAPVGEITTGISP